MTYMQLYRGFCIWSLLAYIRAQDHGCLMGALQEPLQVLRFCWVAVKELSLSYYIGESLLQTHGQRLSVDSASWRCGGFSSKL